jgi:CheY-like chemotaxis protein
MAGASLVKTILIVDDEPVIRALAEESLRGGEWAVKTAPDADRALLLIRQERPDLIFLDLGLPGRGGEDLARELRGNSATAGIPIVYLTGLTPEAPTHADAVVSKPFTPDRLRASAARWL